MSFLPRKIIKLNLRSYSYNLQRDFAREAELDDQTVIIPLCSFSSNRVVLLFLITCASVYLQNIILISTLTENHITTNLCQMKL